VQGTPIAAISPSSKQITLTIARIEEAGVLYGIARGIGLKRNAAREVSPGVASVCIYLHI